MGGLMFNRNMAKRAEKVISIRADGDGDLSQTAAKLAAVRSALREEYEKKHCDPWIVAYSGGKDSTLLLQLVFETVQAVAPKQRRRQVHIVANDTQVESPLVADHLTQSMTKIRQAIGENELPMTAKITKPCIDQTYWVNVIGRGYIPPTRNFRWCTDRLKIMPTTEFITRLTRTYKRTMLLVGTRKAESSARRRRMEQRKKTARHKQMSPHNQIKGCRVFSPIAELDDNEVWAVLLQTRPPWGGTHRNLITLYRNAGGGECPLVLTKEDAPSCGTTSPRFGCWTCTVINKDRSLGGLIDSGHEELEPLYDFRERLIWWREKEGTRMPIRRNGVAKERANGSLVQGPFRLSIRREIHAELLDLQKQLGRTLLSSGEQRAIDNIWRLDEMQYNCHNALMSRIGVQQVAL